MPCYTIANYLQIEIAIAHHSFTVSSYDLCKVVGRIFFNLKYYMKFTKPLIIAGAITTLSIAGATGMLAHNAQAASSTSHQSIIDELVQRFGLNKSDVQAVFDQHKKEIQDEHAQTIQDRIAQAVQDGKITQVQADLITSKQTEVKTFMDSIKDKSASDRAAAMKTEFDALKQWASDNKIPQQFMRFILPPMQHRGFAMGMMHGMMKQ